MPLALFPYPEVHFAFEGDAVVVEAPWMTSRIDTCESGATSDPDLGTTLTRLAASSRVRSLPYWQLAARAVNEMPASVSSHTLCDEATLEDIFTRGLNLMGGVWEWPLEDILSIATTNGACDPLALFCALRRYCLLTQERLSPLGTAVRAALEPLADSSSSANDRLAARALSMRLVHVSRMVTREAPHLLAPSAALPGETGAVMASFLRAERGHDAFATFSLRTLTEGDLACEIPKMDPALRFLLDLMAVCASSYPSALALVIDSFEGLAFDEAPWSPWDALTAANGKHATQGVGAHSELNRREAHANIGYAVAETLGPLDLAEACICARLSELCARVRIVLFERLYSSTGFQIQQTVEVGAMERTAGSKFSSHFPDLGSTQDSK